MPLRPTKGECKGATDITKAFWAFYECPIHNWKGPNKEVTHYQITGIESLVTRESWGWTATIPVQNGVTY